MKGKTKKRKPGVKSGPRFSDLSAVKQRELRRQWALKGWKARRKKARAAKPKFSDLSSKQQSELRSEWSRKGWEKREKKRAKPRKAKPRIKPPKPRKPRPRTIQGRKLEALRDSMIKMKDTFDGSSYAVRKTAAKGGPVDAMMRVMDTWDSWDDIIDWLINAERWIHVPPDTWFWVRFVGQLNPMTWDQMEKSPFERYKGREMLGVYPRSPVRTSAETIAGAIAVAETLKEQGFNAPAEIQLLMHWNPASHKPTKRGSFGRKTGV